VATVALAVVVLVTGATTHAATPETGVARLTVAQKHAIKAAGEWHRGCPVWLSELRVLSYRYYGFDKKTHIGQIVVNRKVAYPLAKVFAKLYRMRFPIRDGAFSSVYGPHPWKSGDVTASFECRNAGASPSTCGTTP